MNFNQILKSLFGDKSSRDMKLIKPLVEKVKAAYPEIQKLTNDELRAKTKEIQAYIQNSAKEQKAQIDELKAKIAKKSLLRLTSSTKRFWISTRKLSTRLCLWHLAS